MKNKFLKKIKYLLLVLFLTTITQACEPDEPEDPTITARDNFIGTWLCTEENKLTYTVTIVKSTDNNNNVLLKNFHHFGQNEHVIGEISGTTITLPQQSACENTWFVNGSGVLTANKKDILFQYTVSDGATPKTVNATYTKQ